MVSKAQIKLITSLAKKKYRIQHGLFVVEGIKATKEFLSSRFELESLFVTEPLFPDVPSARVYFIDERELGKISFLNTPQKVLAVFRIPKYQKQQAKGFILVLDEVRDPGNLGTIIRLCDWFGISQLVCSPQTVDCYNPKVVQATMGSLTRVHVNYQNLVNFLKGTDLPKFGAFMEGSNVYHESLPTEGILIMGNEANGISPAVEALVAKKLSIPQFGSSTTESLNVAMATSILLSEFRRNS